MTEKTDWGFTEEISMSRKEATELFALVESLQAKGKYEEAIQLLEKAMAGPYALVGEDYTRARTMIREMEFKQALREADKLYRNGEWQRAANVASIGTVAKLSFVKELMKLN